ncbi:glycosyltransferase family 2 protein [Variovorax sp. LT1R20]|uniref:glycosyltransferase family 2 protein n=1 Tax=Variovorax sp. LT1R20 TaxID=3443729 RepID=UPI003F44F98A
MFVIPMVGKSRRFTEAGYALPKYRLPLHGQTVFFHVVKSFERYFEDDLFLFVVRRDHDIAGFLEQELKNLGVKEFRIVEIEGDTLGQADTVHQGLRQMPGDDALYVFNIDTIRPGFRKSPWAADAQGYLEVFEGEGEHWSFVEPGPGHAVLRTTEKERISNLCSDGLYHFTDARVFNEAFEHQRANRSMTRGEYYIAPCYNVLIEKGGRVAYELINRSEIVFCGTPQEYEEAAAKRWD